MSQNNSDAGAFLAGFLVGGLVGAAVALVLAPQSGDETRAQLRQKGIELREQGVQTYEQTKGQITEQVQAGRAKLEEGSTELRKRAEKLAADARKAAEGRFGKGGSAEATAADGDAPAEAA